MKITHNYGTSPMTSKCGYMVAHFIHFFSMWFAMQDTKTKSKLRKLTSKLAQGWVLSPFENRLELLEIYLIKLCSSFYKQGAAASP